jgi:periplasmic iron binding protein
LSKAWSGPVVACVIVLGVAAILIFNFQPDRPPSVVTPPPEPKADEASDPKPGNLREYLIGEPVSRNHIQVTAVWLRGVTMDGMSAGPSDLIHLEADVRSLGENPNGFAKNEFIPYLKVAYSIVPAAGGPPIEGDLYPMIASDGLHYGANIAMPKPGTYRLIYDIEPPSAGGLGRHVGVGGVAPWWKPFQAEFEWIVDDSTLKALAGDR